MDLEREPRELDIDALRENLIAYNISQHGYSEVDKAGIFVRNEDGSLAGGIYAYAWGGVCQIELLWVAEDRRGEGLGSRLVSAVEEEALRIGCSKLFLDTFSYQAPGFYEKLGFRIVATVDGFPEGHTYFVLVKDLRTT